MLAPGLTQLRALEGTKLELEAIANKPLAHAVLNVGEAPVGGRAGRSTNHEPAFARH